MQKTADFLKKWPLHCLLLPVYFVFIIYNQYAGLTGTPDLLIAMLWIYAGMAIGFAILVFLFKDRNKAAIVLTILTFVTLFFGSIKAFLVFPGFPHLGSYRYFLPLLLIVLGLILYGIRRAKQVTRLSLYITCVLLVYIGIEVYKTGRWQNSETSSHQWVQTKNSTAPDIYYIIADCYPSTDFQKEILGVPHNFLDSFLTEKKFRLINNSKSNYNGTAFSMSATFGMSYNNWIRNKKNALPFDYRLAMTRIENAPVFTFLQEQQYTLYNYSIFDFKELNALKKEIFLHFSSASIIYHDCIWTHIERDLLPLLFPGRLKRLERKQQEESKKILESNKELNQNITDSLLRFSLTKKEPGRKFVYAHLEMPHFPYFFDSTGKAYPDDQVYGPSMITDKEHFKNYLGYTNKKLIEIISSILTQTKGQAVIILQSDHGFPDITKRIDAFRNYAAYYFPDQEYASLYDGMSNVNTFRVLFNKYFGQQLPLLPDSTVYIK
jgi:hypothetical protein